MGAGTIALVAVAAYFLLSKRSYATTTPLISGGQTSLQQQNALASALNNIQQMLKQQQQPKPSSGGGGIGGGAPSTGGGLKGTGVQGDTSYLPFIDVGTNNPQGIAINTGQPFRVPGGVWNADGSFTADTVGSDPASLASYEPGTQGIGPFADPSTYAGAMGDAPVLQPADNPNDLSFLDYNPVQPAPDISNVQSQPTYDPWGTDLYGQVQDPYAQSDPYAYDYGYVDYADYGGGGGGGDYFGGFDSGGSWW